MSASCWNYFEIPGSLDPPEHMEGPDESTGRTPISAGCDYCKIRRSLVPPWYDGGAGMGAPLTLFSAAFPQTGAGVNSALVAEGLALLEAVKSGTSEHLKTVVFESDSAHLILSLKTGSCIPELYGVAADILSFASVYDSVVFSWISQERNTQADRLAKFALNVSDNMVVDEAFIAFN
ncbi:hypothetical protein F2Q69_00045675 [Brassica cretica]|uniref:RNase H type-1 domain-containing protein n=1 Tax=Brassica cretica TaxID=69181 RepID=A0A8S9NLE5_BRACR|nr:hypothetical protein F2Q69_00045675 [Brassica cretica]